MQKIIVLILLLFFPTIQQASADNLTLQIQEKLIAIGLDPGPADGAWGGKTRNALSEFRAKFGYPPTDKLTGSSILLLNENQPDQNTLPRIGELQTNPVARRQYLASQPAVVGAHCQNSWGAPALPSNPATVVKITSALAPGGKVGSAKDWYSEIGSGFAVSGAACLGGSDKACLKVVHHAQAWAEADALQSAIGRKSKRFDQVQWIAGSILRPAISSYAIARKLVDVPKEVDAEIVDWLYRRATEFYLPERRTPRKVKNQDRATNHQISSALTFALASALVGDKPGFEAAIAQWNEGIISMRDDGSFPTETRRGAWSISYTALQLNYMFGLAELAKHQGMDLPEQAAINKAVEFFLRSLEDYDTIYPYAKANFSSGDKNPSTVLTTAFEQYFGWLAYYASQSPDHPSVARTAGLVLDKQICSEKQIKSKKSTRWRCQELKARGTKRPYTLAQMLAGAPLGHYNAGHLGACTHADRSNYFTKAPVIVPYRHSEWNQKFEAIAWKAAKFRSFNLSTQVVLPSRSKNGSRFSALFVTKNKKTKLQTKYAVRGNKGLQPGWVDGLILLVKKPISQATADRLKKCRIYGSPLNENGDTYAVVRVNRFEGNYTAEKLDCLLKALPRKLRAEYQLMVQQFPDIAANMAGDGSIDGIKNQHLYDLITALADGSVVWN